MARHPDLQAEQAHIDQAYERIEAMRAAAGRLMSSVLDQGKGTPQALAERDVVVRTSLARLEQLDIGDRALCFGRIDEAPAGPEEDGGPSYHIGRLAVSGPDLEPLVVDWRAPVAEPFYRATGRDPMGLVRRRHFSMEGRRLVAIEDELLGRPGLGGLVNSHTGDVPSAALLAALERSRSGRMGDIVATVQREQDEIIRAPLAGLLVVQGGPGTGKTAVALHRAAYLLYTHRFPLERQGVLVVGPNQLFLRYIEQVLPSLGENGVVSITVEGLLAQVPVRSVEPPSLARLKGEAKMAAVVAAAVRSRQRPLARDLVVPFGAATLRLPRSELGAVVAAVRRREGPHNARRRQLEASLITRLVDRYRQARQRLVSGDDPPAELDEAELGRELRRLPVVAEALERMWPRLVPEELLHDLYGAPPLLGLLGHLLSPAEQAALHRPRAASLARVPWTRADIPLLDEARSLLGPVRPGEDDGTRTYGHILVDEAQDLSPMQLRMLARRSLSGSMTLVGDMAQGTGPHAASTWDAITAHLARGRPPRLVELSVNYRTPAEVMEVAARVLAVAAPDLRPPRSVRATQRRPVITRVGPGRLMEEVVDRARLELAQIGRGTVAVVTAASMTSPVGAALSGAGLPLGTDLGADALEAPVTVVAVDMVKGLEFDAVVVVEPAAVVEEAGLRALYVALTRPTQRLAVVHSRNLPVALSDRAGCDVSSGGNLD